MSLKVSIDSKKKISKAVDCIFDENIRDDVRAALLVVPEYFWTVPASTSGKWHPEDERGEGGKVLHTLRAFKIVEHLITVYSVGPPLDDLLRGAVILHDTFFCGFDGRERKDADGKLKSDYMHPFYPAFGFAELFNDHMTLRDIVKIISLSHGKWTVLPVQYEDDMVNLLGWILHLADTIASQRWVKIDVEEMSEETD